MIDTTYYVTEGRIVGKVSGKEAVAQYVDKILQTDKCTYLTYNWEYGVKIKNLIGKPMDYLETMFKKYVNEAFSFNDSITGTSDYTFTREKDYVVVEFTTNTIYGDITTHTMLK